MGSGSWSADSYDSAARMRAATGKSAFDYSDSTRRLARSDWKVNELLDPTTKAGAASPFAGTVMRESRDGDDHPNALPIVVCFDVTGSMGGIPIILQKKLPELFGLLLRKGYVEDPQILMAGVGDAYSDTVPHQIGQFESDNRIDATLEGMFLEGGGGGGNHESYADVAWYIANHTATDAWDKRGRKGYCFFIGDERLYAKVRKDHASAMTDGEAKLQDDVDTKEVFDALKQRYNVYFLFCSQAAYRPGDVLDPSASGGGALAWREVLGENAVILDDAEAVCETIALTIGIGEGTIDLDTGLVDLKEIGSTAGATVGKALDKIGASAGSGAIVAAEGPSDLDATGGSGVTRL